MNRYFRLLEMVRERQPEHIVEIGTHVGKRAAEMMAVSNAYYTGFDLFEDANMDDMIDVAKRIEMIGFHKFALFRGNTVEKLSGWINSEDFQPFDFAFIGDGGTQESIKENYKLIKDAISPGGTIVLDGWCDPPIEGAGCNFIKDGEPDSFTDEYTDSDGNKGTISLLVVEAKDGCN